VKDRVAALRCGGSGFSEDGDTIQAGHKRHLKLTWMTELLHTIALEVWSMAIQYSNRETYSRLYGLVFPFGLMLSMPGDIGKQQVLQNKG